MSDNPQYRVKAVIDGPTMQSIRDSPITAEDVDAAKDQFTTNLNDSEDLIRFISVTEVE